MRSEPFSSIQRGIGPFARRHASARAGPLGRLDAQHVGQRADGEQDLDGLDRAGPERAVESDQAFTNAPTTASVSGGIPGVLRGYADTDAPGFQTVGNGAFVLADYQKRYARRPAASYQ